MHMHTSREGSQHRRGCLISVSSRLLTACLRGMTCVVRCIQDDVEEDEEPDTEEQPSKRPRRAFVVESSDDE